MMFACEVFAARFCRSVLMDTEYGGNPRRTPPSAERSLQLSNNLDPVAAGCRSTLEDQVRFLASNLHATVWLFLLHDSELTSPLICFLVNLNRDLGAAGASFLLSTATTTGRTADVTRLRRALETSGSIPKKARAELSHLV
jgi:hypothetical protein